MGKEKKAEQLIRSLIHRIRPPPWAGAEPCAGHTGKQDVGRPALRGLPAEQRPGVNYAGLCGSQKAGHREDRRAFSRSRPV